MYTTPSTLKGDITYSVEYMISTIQVSLYEILLRNFLYEQCKILILIDWTKWFYSALINYCRVILL